jgi:hypothetical protein
VQLDVTLCRFSCVMRRVHMVTVRGVGMMSRRLTGSVSAQQRGWIPKLARFCCHH